jgi:hypothetical protein
MVKIIRHIAYDENEVILKIRKYWLRRYILRTLVELRGVQLHRRVLDAYLATLQHKNREELMLLNTDLTFLLISTSQS